MISEGRCTQPWSMPVAAWNTLQNIQQLSERCYLVEALALITTHQKVILLQDTLQKDFVDLSIIPSQAGR